MSQQSRPYIKKARFALIAILACSFVPTAFANNITSSGLPICPGSATLTSTKTEVVTETAIVYSLRPSTSAVTTTTSPVRTTTVVPTTTLASEASTTVASSTREVITVTTVPPVVESTIYANCTSGTGPTSTSKLEPTPTPSPTGCVYPSTNAACASWMPPKVRILYAGILDACSIVPERDGSAKWTGVARATFDPKDDVFRLDIQYSNELVNVTGLTVGRAPLSAVASTVRRLILTPTPRWNDVIVPSSISLSGYPIKLSPAEIEDLHNGMTYVTVNTAARPNGAIRGQLYCAGRKCSTGLIGVTSEAPKFVPTSCNPSNQYARALLTEKCFECI